MLALDKKREIVHFFTESSDCFEINFLQLKQLLNIQLPESFLQDINANLSDNLQILYDINYNELGYIGGVILTEGAVDDTLIRFKRRGLYCFNKNINQYNNFDYNQQINKASILLRKAFLSKNLNFLIGSGCSLPVIPLMGQTFHDIKSKHSSIPLGSFDGDSSDIEGYLNWLNTAISFYEKDPANSYGAEHYKYWFDLVKNELFSSIVNYDDEGKSEITRKNYLDFYNTIFSIRYDKDFSPVNIYTTNYDLFNEETMETLNIEYTNGFSGTVNRRFNPAVFNYRLVDDENRYKDKWSVIKKYVKLYKLHGSIDWYFNDTSVRQSNLNVDSENVVIYPTMSKHLETQQSPYSELLRAFTINLQKPDSTLIVLGYGFPDEHLNQLIGQALSNEDFTLIIIGDIEEVKVNEFYAKYKHQPNIFIIGGTIDGLNDGHYFSNFIKIVGGNSHEE